jgi:hypothetical protein
VIRRLAPVFIATVSLLVCGLAVAAQETVPPVAKTYLPPARSPVSFARIPSGQGFSRALSKGTALKRGQTIELVIGKGNDVVAPGDCPCQGLGLVQPKGQKLASAYVQARSPSGKVLATSPAKQLFIEGNGSGGLPIGITYAFARATKPFPKGSKLYVYAFFTSS